MKSNSEGQSESRRNGATINYLPLPLTGWIRSTGLTVNICRRYRHNAIKKCYFPFHFFFFLWLPCFLSPSFWPSDIHFFHRPLTGIVVVFTAVVFVSWKEKNIARIGDAFSHCVTESIFASSGPSLPASPWRHIFHVGTGYSHLIPRQGPSWVLLARGGRRWKPEVWFKMEAPVLLSTCRSALLCSGKQHKGSVPCCSNKGIQ